jgi:hypothetical protein
MYRRLVQVLWVLVALVLFAPKPCLAFYKHWGTQGSYVHQLAHLLFAVAMFFLIFEIFRGELRGLPGFRSLVWACVLLAWWNLDAIVGHTLDWSLRNPVILGQGSDRKLLMEDWHTWAFYVTKVTHFLLLLPAFYFFYRSLKQFSRSEAEYP